MRPTTSRTRERAGRWPCVTSSDSPIGRCSSQARRWRTVSRSSGRSSTTSSRTSRARSAPSTGSRARRAFVGASHPSTCGGTRRTCSRSCRLGSRPKSGSTFGGEDFARVSGGRGGAELHGDASSRVHARHGGGISEARAARRDRRGGDRQRAGRSSSSRSSGACSTRSRTSSGDVAMGPLTGSVAPTKRQHLVDDFTAARTARVLVSQIEAGGVGLNIQAASVVILTEPQWKPSIEEQAIARCHRMGQARPVDVHRLLAEDSVDQRMLEILATKAALFDEYVRRSELKEISPGCSRRLETSTRRNESHRSPRRSDASSRPNGGRLGLDS